MVNNKKISERGQALIIVVFAMVGLIGMVGLAVDGGLAFSDRRQAQNAADTAALAGALGRARPQYDQNGVLIPWDTLARDRADENGYTGDLIHSEVEVYTCDTTPIDCEAPYTGDYNYVQVIITSNVDTFFIRALGIPQVHNKVQAVALADDDDSGPLGNGEGIVSYAPTCTNPENFVVGGTTQVNITGGGLFANVSDPTCGFKCDSNSTTINGDITTTGGLIGLDNSCGDNYDGDTYTLSLTGSPLDFPIKLKDLGLDVPPQCDGPQGSYYNLPAGFIPDGTNEAPNGEYYDAHLDPADPNYPYQGYPTEPITILFPGKYGQFPPPKEQQVPLNDVMIMLPGTYCVSDVIRWNQTKFVLVGHDVTIFIREGYDFAFTGGIVDIDAPDTGNYAGYLIIVEPDYGDPVLSNPPDACYITGGTQNDYTGSIWAPYCDCTLNGNSETAGFNAQLLCYTVKITGGGIVNITYDPDVMGERIDRAKIGPTK